MDLQVLNAELTGDPLVRGYAAMSDQQAADNLNEVTRQITEPFLTGVQIGNQVDLAEFNALSADNKSAVRAMWPLVSIPTQGGFFRAALLAIFPGGTTTRANLLTSFTRTGSRADELGLGEVRASDVAKARAL